MRETIRRPEHREQPRAGRASTAPHGILALQRSAGNRAVSAWLTRQAAPALPAVANGLQHFIDGRSALTALAGRPGPAVDARALNIPAAVAWLTEVNTTLAPLSSPSELIFESTLVSGHDAEYAEAERVTKDALAVLTPATREFATRLRDAIVASINTSSVIDHATNPELGTLDHAKQLRETATALAALDPMLGFKDAAQVGEDAALALLQARSVVEARTTWRANTLRSDAANAARPQNEVDDVIADSGFGNRQSVGDDWCGMFAAANMFRAAAFDKQLRVAFAHTDNVYDYFHYTKTTSDRTPVSIWAEGQWWDLETYHSYRGLPRTFIEGPNAGSDIRPGDIVLIRHSGAKPAKSLADHIVMVESYDPTTGILTSIEGNVTSGVKPGADGTAERTGGDLKYTGVGLDHSASMVEQRNMNDERAVDTTTSMVPGPGGTYQTSGRKTVWFVGRPSLIDFEQHDYGNQPVPDRYKHTSPQEMQLHADSKQYMQKRFPAQSQPDGPYHKRVDP